MMSPQFPEPIGVALRAVELSPPLGDVGLQSLQAGLQLHSQLQTLGWRPRFFEGNTGNPVHQGIARHYLEVQVGERPPIPSQRRLVQVQHHRKPQPEPTYLDSLRVDVDAV